MSSIVRKKSQQGAALLIFMLLLIMASSYTLVSKLNSARKPYVRDIQTSQVLAEAKNALIAYAVNFPERSGTADTTAGPGYLSCPDTDNDGSPNSSCGPNAEGRFPGEFLNVSDYEDSSGNRLWYAVSDNFRNNAVKFQPMNSDTPGQLSIDVDADGDIDAADITDVVAVIIAPGEPVTGQDSRPSNTIGDYLEGENANGDSIFTLNSGGNDRLVYITRQELMSAVEKRILADVEDSINTYQANASHNAFPWLSPFADPSASVFRGVAGTYQGALPYHWAADPDSIAQGGAIAGRNPFTTDITLDWSIVSATVTDPGTSQYAANSYGYEFYDGRMTTPDLTCVQNSTCNDSNYAGLDIAAPIVFNDASCTWSSREVFQCTGSYQNVLTNTVPQQTVAGWGYAFNVGPDELIYVWTGTDYVFGEGVATGWQWSSQIQYGYTETITRTYTIDLTYNDSSADGVDIVAPTNIDNRTRNLTVNSTDDASALFAANSTITITVQDDRTLSVTMSDTSIQNYNTTSTRTLTNNAATTGSISATGLIYDLDVDNSELPIWFTANDWQDLIYVNYASGEPLPGNTTAGQDCVTLGASCLTVSRNGAAINNVRASAVSAGIDLNAARPSGLLTDYMDNVENTDLDDTFLKNTESTTYNDQTRIISTAP